MVDEQIPMEGDRQLMASGRHVCTETSPVTVGTCDPPVEHNEDWTGPSTIVGRYVSLSFLTRRSGEYLGASRRQKGGVGLDRVGVVRHCLPYQFYH